MKRFTYAIGAMAWVFLVTQTAQSSQGLPSGNSAVPALHAVAQRFVPAVDAPLTFASAKKGAAVIELESPWDFDSFGLEVVFAPLHCTIFVTGTSVSTAYCPEEFTAPRVTIEGEHLTLTLGNIDVLRFPFFKVAMRLVSRTDSTQGAWVSFPSALTNFIRVPGKLDLTTALTQPPTEKTLENWINGLVDETLRAAVFNASKVQIGITYAYPVSPPSTEPVFVTLPVVLTDWLTDRSTLAKELADQVQDWLQAHAPSSQQAFLNFSIGIHYEALGQSTLQFQADQVTLDLKLIHWKLAPMIVAKD